MPRLVAATLAGVVLAACVSAPPAPRAADELRSSIEAGEGRSREYDGPALEEVRRAADKVLRLAGYATFPDPEGFRAIPLIDAATRSYGPRPYPPNAFWTVTVSPRGDRIVVHADLRSHYGGRPYELDAPAFAIFFERLDYLLGRRRTWLTCAQATKTWTGRREEGNASVLCYRHARDERPPGLFKFLASGVLVEPDPDGPLPPATPSEAEWLALTTRRYPDLKADRVVVAAREALRRSQPGFAFRDTPDGFVAAARESHVWITPLAGGRQERTHYWALRVRDVGNAALASVYVTSAADEEGYTFAGGGASHVLPGWPHHPVSGAGAYRLFWDRVAWMLAPSGDWPACPASGFEKSMPERMTAAGFEQRSFDPLCFRAPAPPQPRSGES